MFSEIAYSCQIKENEEKENVFNVFNLFNLFKKNEMWTAVLNSHWSIYLQSFGLVG